MDAGEAFRQAFRKLGLRIGRKSFVCIFILLFFFLFILIEYFSSYLLFSSLFFYSSFILLFFSFSFFLLFFFSSFLFLLFFFSSFLLFFFSSFLLFLFFPPLSFQESHALKVLSDLRKQGSIFSFSFPIFLLSSIFSFSFPISSFYLFSPSYSQQFFTNLAPPLPLPIFFSQRNHSKCKNISCYFSKNFEP